MRSMNADLLIDIHGGLSGFWFYHPALRVQLSETRVLFDLTTCGYREQPGYCPLTQKLFSQKGFCHKPHEPIKGQLLSIK